MACSEVLLHRREVVERPPPDRSALVVADPRLARDPGAGEALVKVGRLVAVGVDNTAYDRGGRKPVDSRNDSCLFRYLSRRAHGRFLTRVHDAGHRRPLAVVGAAHEEHLLTPAYDGCNTGHP